LESETGDERHEDNDGFARDGIPESLACPHDWRDRLQQVFQQLPKAWEKIEHCDRIPLAGECGEFQPFIRDLLAADAPSD
jgi:hypothetical protein